MVNLVVRHGGHPGSSSPHHMNLHNNTLQHVRTKSPAAKHRREPPPKSSTHHNQRNNGRNLRHDPPPTRTTTGSKSNTIPSPISVPSTRHQQFHENHRPVSPLTTSESMFGTITSVPINHFSRSGVGVDPVSQSHHRQHRGSRSPPSEPVEMSPPNMRRRPPSPTVELRDEAIISPAASGDLVCDYDDSVTLLYELLESSQWDKARLRCRTHPEEVQTWIIRRASASDPDGDVATSSRSQPFNTKIRWKLLPLHAAVIFQAPLQIIDCLLKEYPIAAGQRDDQGMLPLHLAFRHYKQGDDSILELLLGQYPQGCRVKDRRGRLPIDHGTESDFSCSMVQKYAQVYAKCNEFNTDNKSNERMNALLLGEQKASYEEKLKNMKTMYEEQLAAMAREQETTLREIQSKTQDDEHRLKARHNQEMDELRDLLSREVAATQQASNLEKEVQELRTQLEGEKHETRKVRLVLEEQTAYATDLKEQISKVLVDQKTLTTFCNQQQQQLEEASQHREQLLRSLLEKEQQLDGSKAIIQANRDICELSENLQHRAERLLNRASSNIAAATSATSGSGGRIGGGGGGVEREQQLPPNPTASSSKKQHHAVTTDKSLLDKDDDDDNDDVLHHRHHRQTKNNRSSNHDYIHNPRGKQQQQEELRNDPSGGTWEHHHSTPNHRHVDHDDDDDISAITEVSDF